MDITEWISGRRKLLDAATAAPWIAATGALIGDDDDEATHVWRLKHYDGGALLSIGKVLDNETDTTTIEDTEFIADARNEFPAALNALEAVLALHRPVSRSHSNDCAACAEKCPCPTIMAVEAALNGSSPDTSSV